MKILIKPSELIERCIWDEYVRFELKSKYSKSEISELIIKDEEFEIKEELAFVIGLLNRIYTPYLVYKVNQALKCDLENRSVIVDKRLQINKELLEDTAEKFLRKIPENYKSIDPEFNENLEKLKPLIDIFIYNLNNLEITKYKDAPMVKCKQVKKLINEIFL